MLKMMPPIKKICPKCGSSEVENQKNQEFCCKRCGEIFYFVTPNTASPEMDRYKL